MARIAGYCAIGGFLIPFVLSGIWMLLEKHAQLYLSVGGALASVQLVIWPSSIMMLGTAGQSSINLPILLLSSVVNAAFYALIWTLIWYGIYRHRWVLLPLAAFMIAGWYSLLRM